MLSSYDLRFHDQRGNYLFSFENITSLEYGRKKNDEGIAVIEFSNFAYDFDVFQEDCILEIHRINPYTNKSELKGNTCWFLRSVELEVNEACDEKVTLTFYDTMTILTRRIIAWAGVTAANYPSIMLEPADDIITLIAWYNFGAATVSPTYANSSIPGYTPSGTFSATPIIESWQYDEYGASSSDLIYRQFPINISSPSSASSVINTQRFEFKTCLEAMRDIAEISQLAGESLWFDIEYTPASLSSAMTLTFKTFVNNRGTNRTSGVNRMIIGPEFKNMANVKISKDWTKQAHIMYVGGNGDNELKDMASVSTSYKRYPFYPIESYISANIGDGTGVHETSELRSEGKLELAKRANYQTLSGEIISQSPTEFGKDFFFGDILICKYKSFEAPVEVSEYKISVSSNEETVEIPFSTF